MGSRADPLVAAPEPTASWRYEKCADIHEAFLILVGAGLLAATTLGPPILSLQRHSYLHSSTISSESSVPAYFSTARSPGMRRRIRNEKASVIAKARGATATCLSRGAPCQGLTSREIVMRMGAWNI